MVLCSIIDERYVLLGAIETDRTLSSIVFLNHLPCYLTRHWPSPIGRHSKHLHAEKLITFIEWYVKCWDYGDPIGDLFFGQIKQQKGLFSFITRINSNRTFIKAKLPLHISRLLHFFVLILTFKNAHLKAML